MPSVSFSLPDDNEKGSQKRSRDSQSDQQAFKRRRPEESPAAGDEPYSPHDILEARNRRRNQRYQDSDESISGSNFNDSTHIDKETSLAAEGIAIEPFHVKNESTDGTGYFDGDTYVFRRQSSHGIDEEPDAWLDSLDTNKPTGDADQGASDDDDDDEEDEADSNPAATKAELYRTMAPLVKPNESISQALVRYGRQKNDPAAKQALQDLTGKASALLRLGDVEIYQTKGRDLPVETHTTTATTAGAPVTSQEWEYRGIQDGQIHGPYTTEQMRAWTQAGYFVGEQRVMVRPVTKKPPASDQDDLLADLLDDDDDDNDEQDKAGAAASENKKDDAAASERGDWMWSNQVKF